MNDRAPRAERSRKRPGGTNFERSSDHGLLWATVDAELEVRARIVFALDSIEDGDVRLTEDVLFQLLDDLDRAGWILGRAA